mgnify:FL=1
MLNSMNKRNFFASIILIVLCGCYAYFTANLETRNIQNTTQPSFFPWIITGCLAILSFSLLLQSLLTTKRQTLKKKPAPRDLIIIGFLISLAYFLLLPVLGFLGGNILFFAGLSRIYGEKNILKICLFSVIISIFIFYLFRNVFQIQLPIGILGGVLT